jgi:hypothetical protein
MKLEDLISFAEAADRLRRRNGKKTHVATVHRWASKGVRGIKLEFLQVGGVRCTTMAALERFFVRLSGNGTATVSFAALSNPAVEAALDKEGI